MAPSLLIISEATQNALLGQNNSMTYSFLVIITLVTCTVFMAWLKARSPRMEHVLQGARSSWCRAKGIGSLDEVEAIILEAGGALSILRKSQHPPVEAIFQ